MAQTVTVSAAEDANALVEPVVTLAHAAAGGDYEGAEVAGVVVTVLENDTATLAIGDARGREDAGVLEFVVSLSTASSQTVTVSYATVDGTATAGSDYTGASGVLTFAAGVTESQTIEVQITDDAADDEVEAETFMVRLSGATNAELAVASGTGTIEDDDDPAVTVAFGAASYTAAEGGDDAVVAVTLSADPERTVEIALTAAGGGGAAAGEDYTLSATSLTFERGATAREVRVTAVEEAVDDDGESVTLGFDASGLPAGVTVGSVTAAVVELEDNDEREVRVLPASLTVTEGGAAENYTVVLGSEPTASVTVSMTTDLGDTSVRVEPASLTFTAANWSTAQTVAVRAAEDEDALAEPVVTLGHVASGGDYSGAAVSGVAVRVLENDVPTLAVADATGAEGTGVLRFVVSLSVASSDVVTVGYATEDGTAVAGADYAAVNGRLTFTPGSAGSRTIEVRITDDAEAEDVETFTVELSGETNAVLGQPSATGSIEDNDAPNTPPAAVDAIGEQDLTVGGEAVRVDVSEAFADAEDDRLTYTAETGDAAVATVSVAGTTVTVVPAGFGRTTVTVTASDSKAEATQQFVVVVGLVGSDYAVEPAADGGTVVVLTAPEAPTVRIEVAGGTEGLDTDGDGDVDEQDERPTVQAVSKAIGAGGARGPAGAGGHGVGGGHRGSGAVDGRWRHGAGVPGDEPGWRDAGVVPLRRRGAGVAAPGEHGGEARGAAVRVRRGGGLFGLRGIRRTRDGCGWRGRERRRGDRRGRCAGDVLRVHVGESAGRRADGRRGAVSADAAGRPGREFRPERRRADGDAAPGECVARGGSGRGRRRERRRADRRG